MDCHPKVKVKMSHTVSSGYKCRDCEVRTVTYDSDGAPHCPPSKCLGCGGTHLRLEWRDLIDNTTRVETLHL